MQLSSPLLWSHRHLVIALVAVGCCLACSPTRPPVQFTEAPTPPGGEQFPNWPIPPDVLEKEGVKLLAERNYEYEGGKRTAQGTSGAKKITLRSSLFPRDVDFKWKVAPEGKLDSLNNTPRREIAAYEVQKLFLDPEEYVVPNSLVACVPLEMYPESSDRPDPSVPDTQCVIGLLSLWLEDVSAPEPFFDEERFLRDPRYAYFMSNLQVLTYLIKQRDSRNGNLLVATDENRPQAFAVDNGVAFDVFLHNYFVKNWCKIRIPALRKDSIERLRKIRREALDYLGVSAQLEADDAGLLLNVPPGKNLDPKRGVRIQDGVVQFGLTVAEIDGVWERLQRLVADVDAGKIAVF